jgi:hypothetical protein
MLKQPKLLILPHYAQATKTSYTPTQVEDINTSTNPTGKTVTYMN